MSGGLRVGTWVNVDDCAISCKVFDDDAEFTFQGSYGQPVEMLFSRRALEALLLEGTKALNEMIAAKAEEDDDDAV
ncbi:MAG: hypothetical protein M3548_11935 [Actinomycetota bacterium]|nr:hypothetical protein [Actinomycetota bacterium]